MDSIIQAYSQLREKTHEYGNKLQKNKNALHDVFSPVFNNTTLVLEVLDNYQKYWGQDYSRLSQELQERAKRDNAERIIEITKWSFIHIISCYEFSSKATIQKSSKTEFSEIKSKTSWR